MDSQSQAQDSLTCHPIVIKNLEATQNLVDQVVTRIQSDLLRLVINKSLQSYFETQIVFNFDYPLFGRPVNFFLMVGFNFLNKIGQPNLQISRIRYGDLQNNLARFSKRVILCLQLFSELFENMETSKKLQQIQQSIVQLKDALDNIKELRVEHEFSNRCIQQLFLSSSDQNSELRISCSPNVDQIYSEQWSFYKILDQLQQNPHAEQDQWRKMQKNQRQTTLKREKELKDNAQLLQYFLKKINTVPFLNQNNSVGIPSQVTQEIKLKANQIMDTIIKINNHQPQNSLEDFVYKMSKLYCYFIDSQNIMLTSQFSSQRLEQQRLLIVLEFLTNFSISNNQPMEGITKQDKINGTQFIKCVFDCIFELFHFSHIFKALLNQFTSFLNISNMLILNQMQKVVYAFLQILAAMKTKDLYHHVQKRSYSQCLSYFLRQSSQKLEECTMDISDIIKSDYFMLSYQCETVQNLITSFKQLFELIQKNRQKEIDSNSIYGALINNIWATRQYARQIGEYLKQIGERNQAVIAKACN